MLPFVNNDLNNRHYPELRSVSSNSLVFAGWLAVLHMICRLAEKSVRLMRPSLFSTLAADPGLTASLTAELLQLVQQGVVVPDVHTVYPLSAVAQAQQDLTGRKTTGKLLLRPDTLSG
jgi:NADPH:quinone reductase-like Zn-dependent oxidoreductase